MVDKETGLYAEASLECPYGALLKVLGRPHTLAILYSFKVDSALRFTKLQRELELQPKTLTARLHELVSFGLLTRKSFDEIPPRVEYSLTQKGRDLGPMFDGMRSWADKYQLPDGADARADARSKGKIRPKSLPVREVATFP